MSEKKTRVVSDEEMRRQHEYIRRLNAEFLSRGRQPFAFVETYGCQQNNSDSERIKGMLADIGFAFCERDIRVLVEPELRGLRGDIRFGIARNREPGEILRDNGSFAGYGAEPSDAVVGFRGYGIPGDDGTGGDSGRDGKGVTFTSPMERGGYSS